MGKRDHIKRVFKDFFKKSSASESASTTLSTVLESRLNEPTERVYGAPETGNRFQDAPIRDLWSLALENLSEDKYTVSRIKSNSKLDILRHLPTAAVKKQADCEDQRWKFELNGQQIILRDIAEKIIIWIDKFKKIGDIAVHFDPVHSSLPWGGIRFLLEVELIKENIKTKADSQAYNRG